MLQRTAVVAQQFKQWATSQRLVEVQAHSDVLAKGRLAFAELWCIAEHTSVTVWKQPSFCGLDGTVTFSGVTYDHLISTQTQHVALATS